MENRPFMDKSIKLAEHTLMDVLENIFPSYSQLMELVNSFSQEWNYSKTSGWILKVYDSRKALFYLIPLTAVFKISLTLREAEKLIFLKDETFKFFHNQISTAKKYSEGYALAFVITHQDEYQPLERFLQKLIQIRS